jgi:uncharacterized OsmC-like protein
MSEPIYIARATVEKIDSTHRRARLPLGTTLEFGVHGPIKSHYRLEHPDRPLPIDYVVAATGGCMLSTLNGGLEARGINLDGDRIRADVEGINELRDGNIVLTRIHVHYRLRIEPGARETVERLLARHQEKCPTARSLQGAVDVSWSADITESVVG